MKIGIVTVHSAYNYGAMLQAFATQRVLTEMGHQVQFIDFYPYELEKANNNLKIDFTLKGIALFLYLKSNISHKKRLKRFREFREQLHLSKRYFTKKEIYEAPPKFDAYLVGSDQVWNVEHGMNTFNFLDFVNEKASRKMSYASSFGTEEIPDEYKVKLKELLADFSAISVREDDGVKIVKEATGRCAAHVLDPTLLLSKDEWEQYIEQKPKIDREYILIYALTNTEKSVQMVEALRKRYNLDVVGVPMGHRVPSKFNVNREIKDAGPFEFVSLFRNAKVVCTSSFHGLAFAINFEKTFFVVPHLTRNSRLNSLLKVLDLQDRQAYLPSKIKDISDSELFMDYSSVVPVLNNCRDSSMAFLKKNFAVPAEIS